MQWVKTDAYYGCEPRPNLKFFEPSYIVCDNRCAAVSARFWVGGTTRDASRWQTGWCDLRCDLQEAKNRAHNHDDHRRDRPCLKPHVVLRALCYTDCKRVSTHECSCGRDASTTGLRMPHPQTAVDV